MIRALSFRSPSDLAIAAAFVLRWPATDGAFGFQVQVASNQVVNLKLHGRTAFVVRCVAAMLLLLAGNEGWADDPIKPSAETKSGTAKAVAPSGVVQQPAGGVLNAEEREAVLKAHNAERSRHGKSPLQWDESIARQAQQHAERLAQTGQLQHTNGVQLRQVDQGENLFLTTGGQRQQALQNAVQSWRKEQFVGNRSIYVPGMSYAQYRSRYPGKVFGHWTQMIWGRSRKVGIGVARIRSGSRAGGYVVVARYHPAGNLVSAAP